MSKKVNYTLKPKNKNTKRNLNDNYDNIITTIISNKQDNNSKEEENINKNEIISKTAEDITSIIEQSVSKLKICLNNIEILNNKTDKSASSPNNKSLNKNFKHNKNSPINKTLKVDLTSIDKRENEIISKKISSKNVKTRNINLNISLDNSSHNRIFDRCNSEKLFEFKNNLNYKNKYLPIIKTSLNIPSIRRKIDLNDKTNLTNSNLKLNKTSNNNIKNFRSIRSLSKKRNESFSSNSPEESLFESNFNLEKINKQLNDLKYMELVHNKRKKSTSPVKINYGNFDDFNNKKYLRILSDERNSKICVGYLTPNANIKLYDKSNETNYLLNTEVSNSNQFNSILHNSSKKVLRFLNVVRNFKKEDYDI